VYFPLYGFGIIFPLLISAPFASFLFGGVFPRQGRHMRISEHRYNKDRLAIDVAARLIDFEVRTSTIQELTGLSPDRIRSLSKECGVDGSSTAKQRHRGRSPGTVKSILGIPRVRDEAGPLLALCQLMGVPANHYGANHRSTDVSRAQRLCDVFWTFRYLLPQARISFEHMLLLLSKTAAGGEMAGAHCVECNALIVVDALSLYDSRCSRCTEDAQPGNIPGRMQFRCVAEEAPVYT
jgi:hypothetical protein